MRTASAKRTTKETDVEVTVNLDGEGRASVATGIGFLDHMLELLARHSRIDWRSRPRAICTSTITTPPKMSALRSARRCGRRSAT
jgi:hypothetical protein